MSTPRELLADAADRLRAAGVPSPAVDAELLLAHATGRPRAMLRMAGGEVTLEQRDLLERLVERRVARVPLQHLTGRAPFRHLELSVGPGVFIPRPETELVVDLVGDHLRGSDRRPAPDGRRVLVDLCTGSGALALALATELPGSRVLAVEISADALTWARRNVDDQAAALARADSIVELVHSDATAVAQPGGPMVDLRGRVDVVVTNPPYVPDGAVPREPEVRDHDPHLALYGGPDGLAVVRPLARQAALLLRPGGLLVVEHADAQGEDAGEGGVPAMLRREPDPSASPDPNASPDQDADPDPADAATPTAAPPGAWRAVADHLDLAGLPRHTTAIRSGAPSERGRAPTGGRMSP